MDSTEIEQRMATIQSEPSFDIPELWLTFYLTAPPNLLAAFAEKLAEFHAVNLTDAEGGFLYPKLLVPNSASQISSLIEQVRSLAAQHNVEVISVDADTTTDPSTSRFAEIIRYERNVG
ncbi:MAG: hypothetical protein C0494_08270 [Sphingobium sp.]|nr:hypothetical protein [Sphingobium sp.]